MIPLPSDSLAWKCCPSYFLSRDGFNIGDRITNATVEVEKKLSRSCCGCLAKVVRLPSAVVMPLVRIFDSVINGIVGWLEVIGSPIQFLVVWKKDGECKVPTLLIDGIKRQEKAFKYLGDVFASPFNTLFRPGHNWINKSFTKQVQEAVSFYNQFDYGRWGRNLINKGYTQDEVFGFVCTLLDKGYYEYAVKSSIAIGGAFENGRRQKALCELTRQWGVDDSQRYELLQAEIQRQVAIIIGNIGQGIENNDRNLVLCNVLSLQAVKELFDPNNATKAMFIGVAGRLSELNWARFDNFFQGVLLDFVAQEDEVSRPLIERFYKLYSQRVQDFNAVENLLGYSTGLSPDDIQIMGCLAERGFGKFETLVESLMKRIKDSDSSAVKANLSVNLACAMHRLPKSFIDSESIELAKRVVLALRETAATEIYAGSPRDARDENRNLLDEPYELDDLSGDIGSEFQKTERELEKLTRENIVGLQGGYLINRLIAELGLEEDFLRKLFADEDPWQLHTLGMFYRVLENYPEFPDDPNWDWLIDQFLAKITPEIDLSSSAGSKRLKDLLVQDCFPFIAEQSIRLDKIRAFFAQEDCPLSENVRAPLLQRFEEILVEKQVKAAPGKVKRA